MPQPRGVDLAPYIDEIAARDRATCARLRFTPRELDYLRGWRFFKSDFVDLLGLFQLDERFIQVTRARAAPGEIDITIKGPWLHTILFEVPVLAIVSRGLLPQDGTPRPTWPRARRRLAAKIAQINAVPDPAFRIADYGTRRRFSRAWQDEVVRTLKRGIGAKFVGTSNVKFALDHNLTPLGTMAHEYMQACQAVGRGCAIRRCSRSTPGRANTAATSASRCPTSAAWTPSCATSTCSSASCSTACATTPATRSSGARS